MNEKVLSSTSSTLELAGALGVTDPNVLRLVELMSAREDDEPAAQDTCAAPEINPDQLNVLIRENRELHEENRYLVCQIETLAAALGACPVCWGEDQRCRECRGRGAPGAFPPDKRAFSDFVAPTIRRMRKAACRQPSRTDAMQQTQHDENGLPTPEAACRRKENE
jgi:hypothetical protein